MPTVAAARAPSVVLIGGGTGSPQLLVALRRKLPAASLAIVLPVTDSGRSTGRIRRILGIPGPGDLRHCLAALAGEGSEWGELLERRITAERHQDLDGMAVGNLILGALTQELGNIGLATRRLAELLNITETVLPATIEDTQLTATLADGTRATGEIEVRRPGKAAIAILHIEGATAGVWPPTRAALAGANVAILGPGSLWTSIGGVLTVPGVAEAINPSARLIFVCNTTTQPGQTDGLSFIDHFEIVSRLAGRAPNAVVVNSARPDVVQERSLAQQGLHMVLPHPLDTTELTALGITVLSGDLLSRDSRPAELWQKAPTAYHDMDRTADTIVEYLATKGDVGPAT